VYVRWYDLGGGDSLNEVNLRATADAMVAKGLVAAGYTHLNLDDGFIKPKPKLPVGGEAGLLPDPGGRLPNGSLVENPVKFPSGLRALSDYVQKAGMTLGLYTARGRITCCGLAGSLNHEAEDARRFAVDWNVSYVKVDSCHGTPPDPKGSPPGTAAIAQYRNFSRALNATGRHVILDACWDACWPPASCMTAGLPLLIDERMSVANSWRIGPDGISWGRTMLNIELDANLSSFAGAGHWNNPGLLISASNDGATPGARRRISETQVRTQFSLFALLASPLMISGSVIYMSPMDVQTYTNREVLAISQDGESSGHPAQLTQKRPAAQLTKTPHVTVAGGCHQGTRLVGAPLVNEKGNPIGAANVWGRRLEGGGLALLLVNTAGTVRGQGGANISCDAACFRASGWSVPTAGTVLHVRDVWGKSNSTLTVTGDGPTWVARNISTDGCVLLVISNA
jgi:hypothetical protein